MKKRILWVTLAIVLVMAMFPASALAYIHGGVNYDDTDFVSLRSFLEQPSASPGVKNGEQINPGGYDADDPTTWTGVSWNGANPKRVTHITTDWNNKGLAGSLDLSSMDMLEYINVYQNSLEVVDVSGCTSLTTLNCSTNSITTIDVAGCTALTSINCASNDLASLDMSTCTNITSITCSFNPLTSLNVTGCTLLETLVCNDSLLATLDVSTCSGLKSLTCGYTQMTSLDVTGCPILEELLCPFANLTSVSLSGGSLTELDLYDNQLTSIDLSSCNVLEYLDLGLNQLTSLDITGMSTLVEVDVDENQLTSLDLTGLTSLEALICYENNITSLDLSDVGLLELLVCGKNNITSLDLSNTPNLYIVECSENQLTTLDCSMCPNVFVVFCQDNNINTLNLTGLMISALDCSNNNLSTLEVFGALELLDCLGNPLGYIKMVTEGNEIVRAVGDGYVGVFLDTDEEEYYAVATPVDPLINWTEGGTELSQNVRIDLRHREFEVVANFLGLITNPTDGKIYVGNDVKATANFDGGTWGWDSEFLSSTGTSNPEDFTGLKEGTTQITYTIGQATATADVEISVPTPTPSQVPNPETGSNTGAALRQILITLAVLMLVATGWFALLKWRSTHK